MKRTLILTVILLVFLMMPQYSYADSYEFNDGGITIDLSGKITAYTENSDVSDIKGHPDDFNLMVHSEDYNYYWYFYYLTNDSVLDFASMSDDEIKELVANDSTGVEMEDVAVDVYDNGNKYLVMDYHNKETDQYIHFYVTGVSSSLYYFVSYSYESPLLDVQKADLKKVIAIKPGRVTITAEGTAEGKIVSDSCTVVVYSRAYLAVKQKADLKKVIDGLDFVKKEPPTKLEERQQSMIRILKRFGLCVVALAIFIVIKLGFEKIRGARKK